MFLFEHRSSRPLLGHRFEPSPPPSTTRRSDEVNVGCIGKPNDDNYGLTSMPQEAAGNANSRGHNPW